MGTRYIPLLLLVLLSPATDADPVRPVVIGEHLRDVILETPHPYPAAKGTAVELVWSDHYFFPGAKYLVFEFRELDLAPGDRVEVHGPKDEQVQVFRDKGRAGKGAFLTKMIPGPEATIELYAGSSKQAHYGYRIERITRGLSDAELAERGIVPETICGTDDSEDAVCYASSFPDVYAKSRAVARILMDGSALCTAWIVSCENHLITANHCTWDDFNFDRQEELDRMEFQFLYQEPACGGSSPTVADSFVGGTWLESDRDLDYTLIQAPAGENPAAVYGWLPIDYRLPDIDEPIYLVGHPGGRPKQIALYSTASADQDNPDGFCEVYSTSQPVCVGGTALELGYFCDSEGAGSGSPVLSRNTNRVVALHHCPDCPNRGVRIQNIWDHNQAGIHPLPSCAFFGAAGTVELDRGRYRCADTMAIALTDGSLVGAGSQSVTAWSSREPTPQIVTLLESPAGSGTFAGTVQTTAAAPASGDGLLSVSHGNTITVRYVDLDDGAGGTNVAREVGALADCVGPTISLVHADDVLGRSATIAWTTNEPTNSRVSYATLPPAWSVATDTKLSTSHAVRLEGLSECTDYLYRVESTDEAGNATVADNGGHFFVLATLADVARAFAANDLPRPIIDRSSTYSTIHVDESAPVVDVDVTVTLDHPYDADLEIYLRGPNGVEIELSSDNGGAGSDYTATVLDDEAPASIQTGSAPFSGRFRPEQPLATFDGLSAAGSWILRAFDDSTGDMGTFVSWTLELTFPPNPCGPHASCDSHALSDDQCALGGSGDSDGIWDAGERIDFLLAIENDGTTALTGVQATVSALTPGVTVLERTRAYGNLAPGAQVESAAPFAVDLPDALACGTSLSFQVDVFTDQGMWSDWFEETAGRVLPSSGTVLDESFDFVGLPASWTIVDGGQSTASWFTDNAADPLGCVSTNPAPPIAGSWAAVDSDCAGEVSMDESLVTPPLDLRDAQTVTLAFDHWFRRSGTETTAVDVRSARTGGNWTTVRSWSASTTNPTAESINITAQAAGVANVQIRWHYYGANFDWYWYVDNVRVSFAAAGGCAMRTCLTGSPPGEQTGLGWPNPTTLTWTVDPAATAGYTLYRGTAAGLPLLGNATVESCVRFRGTGPGANSVVLTTDGPPTNTLYWYLVTGSNAVGEGPAGSGTDGPRIVDASGSCAP